MSDYTPTTDQIRAAWIQKRWEHLKILRGDSIEEFDRWFQSEIEKAARTGAEEALRIVMEGPVTFRGTNE